MTWRVSAAIALFACVALGASEAGAQTFGIGPRLSFVRSGSGSTPSTRLVGGVLRLATGAHTVLEGSLDYRAFTNEAGTMRTTETPLQGSLLLFVSRSAFAPYLVGGIGVYSQVHEALGATGLVTGTTTEKRVGWHLGIGAEIRVASHAALFADYRYRFVRWGDATSGEEPITVPGSTIVPALQSVKLAHEGSMWTSGLAFYF